MRIAAAMSGGLNSSLTAAMLKKTGHEIIGITAQFLHPPNTDETDWRNNACCNPENIISAKRIAKQFDFNHKILHLEEEYSREVIDYYCSENLKGRTPSTCLVNNYRVKFKRIIEFAKSMECKKLAAGYYARLRSRDGRYWIARGMDRDMDESYFLSMLPQEMLEHLMLPLGEYNYDAIERMAGQMDLPVTLKEVKQDIFFMDKKSPEFIEERTGITPPPGDIVDTKGNVIGSHNGIHRFTIGQRKGLNVSCKKPLYVIDIDAARNIVIAGQRENLNAKGFYGTRVTYMCKTSLDEKETFVKIDSSHNAVKSKMELDDKGIRVYFTESQMNVTPGQAAVFYNNSGDILASAWIDRRLVE